jgi:hypothetical protein
MDSMSSLWFDNSNRLKSFRSLKVLQGFRPLGNKPLIILSIFLSLNDLELSIFKNITHRHGQRWYFYVLILNESHIIKFKCQSNLHLIFHIIHFLEVVNNHLEIETQKNTMDVINVLR